MLYVAKTVRYRGPSIPLRCGLFYHSVEMLTASRVRETCPLSLGTTATIVSIICPKLEDIHLKLARYFRSRRAHNIHVLVARCMVRNKTRFRCGSGVQVAVRIKAPEHVSSHRIIFINLLLFRVRRKGARVQHVFAALFQSVFDDVRHFWYIMQRTVLCVGPNRHRKGGFMDVGYSTLALAKLPPDTAVERAVVLDGYERVLPGGSDVECLRVRCVPTYESEKFMYMIATWRCVHLSGIVVCRFAWCKV